jgi:hypothetical protein
MVVAGVGRAVPAPPPVAATLTATPAGAGSGVASTDWPISGEGTDLGGDSVRTYVALDESESGLRGAGIIRRSRRTALVKIAHLAADPSDVLRIQRGSGVTTYVRFDADRNRLYALTDRRGTVGTPEAILN